MKEHYGFQNIPSGDIRISITNMCNMECSYCHNEGQNKGSQFMDFEEFCYIVDKSIFYGVHKIRITGGEPTLHPRLRDMLNFLCKYRGTVEVGINTNLVQYATIQHIVEENMVDKIVVGIDYYSNKVSKDSAIGLAPSQILDRIDKLIGMSDKVKIELDVVFLNNFNDICLLYEWAEKRNIVIKILEICSKSHCDSSYMCGFDEIILLLKGKYGLDLGIDRHLKEKYLFDVSDKKRKMVFYQSHCNRNECDVCRKMHLRINSYGVAKPCLYREDSEQSLLDGNFDEKMSKAIYYMGECPL